MQLVLSCCSARDYNPAHSVGETWCTEIVLESKMKKENVQSEVG